MPPPDPLEAIVPFERLDSRARAQDDAGHALDPLDQISRHALGKPRPAHEHVHARREPREEPGGLPSRVSTSDDGAFFALAELALEVRGAVINAGPLVARERR